MPKGDRPFLHAVAENVGADNPKLRASLADVE